ncbi:hydroxylamine reductase [Desulfotruncus arcticus]|nr:hydroxylamine reductase [Desulfotruncus arcticus]
MFCNQCEQTAKGTACTIAGVCGKTPEVSSLQDLLLHAVKGLSLHANEGRKLGIVNQQVNAFTVKAIFSTLTNVDFDPERFQSLINRCVELREQLKGQVSNAGGKVDFSDPSAAFTPDADLNSLIKQGEDMGLIIDRQADEDIQSLQLILVYGIKGVSAYADHARILGQEDDSIYAFIHEAMAALTKKDLSMNDWLNMVLKCGEINLKTLELLDKANTDAFGHPVPTPVPLGHKQGKCILVSGHDLKDLSDLLEQTEGKNINIYTHGELLPAHGYPGLKKHRHLYGHFGTAWQNQKKEFPNFPGAILMTTNCMQEPQKSYHDNIFSTGLVGWPGVRHVENGQFSPVIEKALELPGFPVDEDKGTVMVGFGRSALFGVSDKIIDLVKKGAIKHFFLVAGCDGAKPGRNYFTEFVQKVPGDSVVLTLACGKFRFFDLDMGEIEGIPRLIDIGQCNDAYSAIQIALALAKAFDCGVNDLPLHMVLSWYEQKAVAILLTLLYLGIKDIRLGPSLPAFISPNVLDVLVQNFNIKPITTPDEDLAAILNKNH